MANYFHEPQVEKLKREFTQLNLNLSASCGKLFSRAEQNDMRIHTGWQAAHLLCALLLNRRMLVFSLMIRAFASIKKKNLECQAYIANNFRLSSYSDFMFMRYRYGIIRRRLKSRTQERPNRFL